MTYLLDQSNVIIPRRDTADLGHFGTGNFELTISNENDVETAEKYIQA